MSISMLIAGLINIETTLAVEGFPLPYFPVTYPFFGIQSRVSGVGYNIAKALRTLGHPVQMLSLIGDDRQGQWVRDSMAELGIAPDDLLCGLTQTCESVVLFDPKGKRQIHTDLKNIQRTPYPLPRVERALARADLAVLCNINFARPMIKVVRQAGKAIATDVHVLGNPDDDYNRDFMAAANILFVSDEALGERDAAWFLKELHSRYHNDILVMGQGANGALMYVASDRQFHKEAAVVTRPVVNTVGAGDALFSAFLHAFSEDANPYRALRQAVHFASWKIGEAGAAEGFLNAADLRQLVQPENTASHP